MRVALVHCPTCKGALHSAANGWTCTTCARAYPALLGAIDLRSPERRTTDAVVDDVLSIVRDRPLDEALRRLAQSSPHGARSVRLQHGAEGIEYAWKLMIPLRADMRALDLGCGLGARAASLARHRVNVVAVATDPVFAAATSARLAALGERSTVILIDDLARIPVDDASIDFVALPVDLDPGASSGISRDSAVETASGRRQLLMSEVNRTLRPDADAVLVMANRWSLDRVKTLARNARRWVHGTLRQPSAPDAQHSASSMGLEATTRFLRSAGLEPSKRLVVARDRGGALSSLDDPSATTSRHLGVKQRINADERLAAEWVMIARRGRLRTSGLLERVLTRVHEQLAGEKQSAESVSIVRRHVSRKDKIVLEIDTSRARAIVRLCLSPASRAAEQRAATTLEALARSHMDSAFHPRLLASGDVDGLFFTAEQKLEGRSLASGQGAAEATRLDRAADLLRLMNPDIGGHAPPVPLVGSLYDELVAHPLARVAQLFPEPDMQRKFARFFERHLKGIDVSVGVAHGDFSLSNILIRNDGGLAAIDWENSKIVGLPILDAIGVMRSNALRRGSADAPGVARRRMALKQLSESETAFLAAQYERCGIPGEAHAALVYLQWVDVVSSLMDFSFMQRADALGFYVDAVIRNLPDAVLDG